MFQARRLALPLTICLTLLATAGGCSRDIHVFRSTASSPKNVSIISATTGETLWSMNVPEGQQLRLDFDRSGGSEIVRSPDVPAKTVKWELWTLDASAEWGQNMKGGSKLDSDKVDLPNQPTFMGVKVREASNKVPLPS